MSLIAVRNGENRTIKCDNVLPPCVAPPMPTHVACGAAVYIDLSNSRTLWPIFICLRWIKTLDLAYTEVACRRPGRLRYKYVLIDLQISHDQLEIALPTLNDKKLHKNTVSNDREVAVSCLIM